MVRGDLLDRLSELASQVPAGATPVIFHTAVLAYVSARERERFRGQVRALRAHWISNEAADVIAGVAQPRDPSIAESHFLIASGGREPLAFCDPHGRWLQWLRGRA